MSTLEYNRLKIMISKSGGVFMKKVLWLMKNTDLAL